MGHRVGDSCRGPVHVRRSKGKLSVRDRDPIWGVDGGRRRSEFSADEVEGLVVDQVAAGGPYGSLAGSFGSLAADPLRPVQITFSSMTTIELKGVGRLGTSMVYEDPTGRGRERLSYAGRGPLTWGPSTRRHQAHANPCHACRKCAWRAMHFRFQHFAVLQCHDSISVRGRNEGRRGSASVHDELDPLARKTSLPFTKAHTLIEVFSCLKS